MQTIDKFNSNLSTAILLTGGAGAGKTTLGMRLWPKVYVAVLDLNFQSGIDYLQKINETSNVVGFDTILVDESGKPVAPAARWPRLLDGLTKAIADSTVDVILIDGATQIEDVIKARICGATTDAAIKLDGFKQWGDLVIMWKSLIMQLRQSGKKIVMISHENKERDESDQIWKYSIAVDGSIRGKLPALFSDVWRCEVVEQGIGAGAKHVWNVRTLGNTRQEHLKRSSAFSNLAPVILQDDLVKHLRK